MCEHSVSPLAGAPAARQKLFTARDGAIHRRRSFANTYSQGIDYFRRSADLGTDQPKSRWVLLRDGTRSSGDPPMPSTLSQAAQQCDPLGGGLAGPSTFLGSGSRTRDP